TKYGETEPLVRPTKTLAHLMETMQVDHVADMAVSDPPSLITRLGGARTVLNVALMRGEELVGVLGVYPPGGGPCTRKQIELVQNFAAQAVIAIENTRLLNELRESLQQQTAISDILRVISSSPSDVIPVFQSVAEHAARICEAQFVDIVIVEDGMMRIGA